MHLKYLLCLALCLSVFIACNTSQKTLATTSKSAEPKAEESKVEQTKTEEPKTVGTDSARTSTFNVLSGMSVLTPPPGQEVTVFKIPSEVIASPGEKQLVALQSKYQGITLETLQLGHEIFNSTCTGCHGQKSIYERSEETWHAIIEDMALLAELNIDEKDAVMKYVLSVKATETDTRR